VISIAHRPLFAVVANTYKIKKEMLHAYLTPKKDGIDLSFSLTIFPNRHSVVIALKFRGIKGRSKLISAMIVVKSRIAIRSGFLNRAHKNPVPPTAIAIIENDKAVLFIN
jgi:hypothetical protein